MANVSLTEQLDRVIEMMLANREALPSVDARIAAQFRIATILHDLPRPDFRERLKTDLQRRMSMTTSATKPVREGFYTVTPYLIVREAKELLKFVKEAFGAEELYRGTGSAGGIHAEVRIGDSIVMIGGGGAWLGDPKPTALHLYVKDADSVYERAIQAGGISMREPVDQFYGDREAGVKDLSGNHWYIATHMATGHAPEGFRAVTPFLQPRGAARVIEFLERAFGAQEQDRTQSPDGVIQHAVIKIGDSLIEMGEANGPWEPMPTTFYMYVDDVDGWYRRAVEAGAVSQSEPADQPYGDRLAGVLDPFENVWYIATRIGG